MKSNYKNIFCALIVISICFHLSITQLYIPYNIDLNIFANGLSDAPYKFRLLTVYSIRLYNSLFAQYFNYYVSNLKPPFNDTLVIYKFFSSFFCLLLTSYFNFLTGRKIGLSYNSRLLSLYLLFLMVYFNISMVGPQKFYLPYDLPGLLFFSIIIYLISANNLKLIPFIFIIATLNRETSLLYLIPLLAYSIEKKKFSNFAIFITCCFIWLVTKFLITHIIGLPNDLVFFNQAYVNLQTLYMPMRASILLSSFGFLWIPIFVYWKSISVIWLRYSVATYLIWFFGMFFVGILIELRVFNELSCLASLHLALIYTSKVHRVNSTKI